MSTGYTYVPAAPIDEDSHISVNYGWFRPAIKMMVAGRLQWVSQFQPHQWAGGWRRRVDDADIYRGRVEENWKRVHGARKS